MELLKSINIKKSILLLKKLNNGTLAIIDAQNTLRIIDLVTYSVAGGFKSNIEHDRLIGSHVDISADGAYSMSIVPGTDKAALFSTSKKELLYKIGRHQGEIESVGIDSNDRYCVTCGQDGKAFAWFLKTSRMAFAMPPHADYITTVAFSENAQWVATGSFDRSIHVMNLATMKQQFRLCSHTSAIVKIVFLPDSKLLSVDKDGNLILWDLRNGKIIKRLTRMNDEVTTMTASHDGRFVFVGTKLGYVGLYDLKTLEQLKYRYIKESESVTALAFLSDPYRLAIGTIEGNVKIYSLFGNEDHYLQLLREGKYRSFYHIVEENPILLFSKAYEAAERIWTDVLNKARGFLEQDDRARAKDLLDLFAGIPAKNAFITQLLKAYEKYGLFLTYVQEGRYSLAYPLAKQYPAFQDSEPYHQMESKWKRVFAKAQELILQPNGDEQARQILSPFRGISDKTVLIQELFEQRKLYEFFKKVIVQKDFVKFFELVKLHPFLKEFNEYDAVMDYADKLYVQAQKGYMNGEYATAKKACDILVAFPDYAAEAQEMNDTIRIKHLFFEAIAANNLISAFSYLTSYPLLYDTPQAQLLEKQWNAVIDKAQRFAAKGQAGDVLGLFAPYRTIRDKYFAMAGVVAQAYCVQLEQMIRNNAPKEKIEAGIRKYVEIFGVEEGVLQVFDYFKNRYTATKLDLEMLRQGSFETWSPSIFISEIAPK